MRKGLTLTLMTVAVAMLGIQAMAMAPVISDLPSPVVGSGETATAPNRFVYPDAFDLSAYVTDDNTADADIQWSYEAAAPVKYNINGVAPIDTTTEDPTTPGSKRIDNQDLDPSKVDSNPQTITIRNVNLSPISGTQTDPATTGVLDSETQMVTLFASDGTTYSEVGKTMFIYTDNGGSDRLSRAQSTPVTDWTFDGSTEGWTFSDLLGGCTSGTSGSTAICMTTGLTGDFFASWVSPQSDIPVVANAVYHIRVQVNGSHTSPGATPLWDMYLNNYDGVSVGANLYGGEIMFYDSEGGANAAIQDAGGGKAYDLWWAPLPAASAAWNDPTTGGFSSANVAKGTSCSLVFRTLDLGTRTDLLTASQDGQLCMTVGSVERYALGDMVAGTEVYGIDATTGPGFVAANSGGTGTILVASLLSTSPTIDYTGGILTITPSASTSSVDLLNIDPGSDLLYDLGNSSTVLDNYPVPWQSDKLLQITAELIAPNSTSETDPPDAIQLGVDEPGNEIIMTSFITRLGEGTSATAGMPKQAGYVPYMAFIYTHTESVSTKSWYHNMRPRLSVVNNQGLTGAGTANAGGFRCRSLKVTEVHF